MYSELTKNFSTQCCIICHWQFINNWIKHKVRFKKKVLAINGTRQILLDSRKVNLKMFERSSTAFIVTAISMKSCLRLFIWMVRSSTAKCKLSDNYLKIITFVEEVKFISVSLSFSLCRILWNNILLIWFQISINYLQSRVQYLPG